MDVLRLRDVDASELMGLLSRYELELERIAATAPIPGSYWGESEAGLIAARVYARDDTPVHSLLHETAHVVCMTPERRSALVRDAGGDDEEESAVCYLQVLLSDHVECISRSRLFSDMDSWGYSFRSGSTSRWFHDDADDASCWLQDKGLIDENQQPTWICRAS